MKAFILLIAALTFAVPHASSKQPEATAPTPAWVQKFNTLPEETRKQYIGKFQEAERFFAQKRTLESLFSLLELEKIFDGNPGLYNLRGACYIEIRNIEKALENFEKALKLDPENLTVQFNLAEALYVSHDYAKALKAFTELLPHFKDTDKNGIIPLLQFKRYICARKLDNQPLAKELEGLYGPMDDTPYYYCIQAVMKYLGGDQNAAQEQVLSAFRIYQGTSALQAFTDAMTEAGILPSPYGQTVPNQPEKTGLEKSRS
mgnify:FL=1